MGYTKPRSQSRYYRDSDGSSVNSTLIRDETSAGEHSHLIPKYSPAISPIKLKLIFMGAVAICVGSFLIGLFITPPGDYPLGWQRQRLAFQKDRTQWELEEKEWTKSRQQYLQDRQEWEKQQTSYNQDRKNWEADRDAMKVTRIKFEAEFEYWESQRVKWASQLDQWEREKRRHDGSYPPHAPGSFWDKPEIAKKCYAYGKREYIARLWNVPNGWNWGEACNVLPNEFHGVTFMTPDYCEDLKGRGMWGHWIVSSGEIECQPMLKDFNDLGCVAPGSRTRRIGAQIINIREEDDWQLMCGTTPAIIDGVHYLEPSHCEARFGYGTYAIWDISDFSC